MNVRDTNKELRAQHDAAMARRYGRIYWTVAYLKPRGRKVYRVTDWAGNWNDAFAMAAEYAETLPDSYRVFFVPSPDADREGYTSPDDIGNLLIDGRRVPYSDTVKLPVSLRSTR